MLLAQDMAAVEGPMGDMHTPPQRFNSLSPVNTLPPELLGLIFTFLVRPANLQPKPRRARGTMLPDPQYDRPTQVPQMDANIVRVTHVCKYWRAVAIETPDLWASFAVFHPGLVQECLVRSKTVPLSVSIGYAVSPHVSPILGDSVHRLRSAYVFQKTKIIESIWRQQLFTRPAPSLEELFIENTERHCWMDGAPIPEDATSPLPAMFSGVIPRLRILVLKGVPMPFTSLPDTLVHLEIGGLSSVPLPSFPFFLAMLRACSSLQTVNIAGSFEGEAGPLAVASDAVALPKLERLYMELEPTRAPGVLLASLALPAHADVAVLPAVHDGGRFRTLLGVITPSSAPPCFQSFRCLRAAWDTTYQWNLQAYRETSAQSSSGRAALEIDGRDDRWALPNVPEDWAGFLYDWPFDPSQIEMLVLDHHPETEGTRGGPFFGQWDRVFGQLPALTSLTAKHLPPSEMESLLEALKDSTSRTGLVCRGLVTVKVSSKQISDRARSGLAEVALARSLGMRESLESAFQSIHIGQ
ncbi:hypothetical protein BD311DRAFT_303442 [Dichomitus squalens]|uniref:F-box domain-containing protein n=1 Tax=Dichomitus squalens TaxID=114155 RepID=A0A4V2K0I2_9APHY|nr:hypothetical protein BD311DRAFT_303442 [Dichomitus squalens]